MDTLSMDVLSNVTNLANATNLADLGHLTQLAGQLGQGGLDQIGHLMDRLGHVLGTGLDVQAAPPIPNAAPVSPVEGGALPSATPAPGATMAPGGPMMGAAAQGRNTLSPWALFMQADLVVKAVMVALVLSSVWCWSIIFEKIFRIRGLNRRAEQFEEKFWSGGSLEELYDRMGSRPKDPMGAVFVAAMREWRHSAQRRNGAVGAQPQLAQRIERVMGITLNRELETLERRLGFLASTGSVAPFVGLFGTVWGIMNSFHAIGMSNDTSLATVAPGIAEALFATALGLVAAIPAVIAYNKLSADIDRYAGRLEAFSGEFGAILGRQLDERE
ncbi:MAG: protein TolQ [Rhodospirillum sp.]|nr:protein TolQ [Rhodospirillum sp.]MCF8488035.1 protein TolQ [Rhodospirillum sp.]MCF8500302.1 protein TolQ [Rhodospirillum sp.]